MYSLTFFINNSAGVVVNKKCFHEFLKLHPIDIEALYSLMKHWKLLKQLLH